MKSHRYISLLLIALCFTCVPSFAVPSTAIYGYLEEPKLVGKARLKVLLWNVFDASLYSDSGQYDAARPFALSLKYLRSLDGEKIVTKSMEEIENQKPDATVQQLGNWEQQLLTIIPDVRNGSVITGVRTIEGFTFFYQGERKLGAIEDVEFTKAFFGIWLGERTSEPKFRNKLIGNEHPST